jgi:hypothetical protein
LRVNRVDGDGAVLDASQPIAAMRGFDALAAVGRTNDAFLAWGQVGSVVGGFVSADGSMQGEAATLFAIDSSVRVKELVAAGPADNGEMLVAALLVHDGYWGTYRRDFYGQFYYEIRAVRVGPTGTVLSPPVTLASAVNGPDVWESYWVPGSLADLRIAFLKSGFYVAWNDSVPVDVFTPMPAHAKGLAWHVGHESPSAVQSLGARLAGLTATRDRFIVSTDRLIRISFTDDTIQEDHVSLRSGELLFDGSSAFMLAWGPTSAVPKADLFVVGPAGLEPTETRLDLLPSDGAQHASDGQGRTLLTYRHSSNGDARVMERLLTTALRPEPPDAGADASDAHDGDAPAPSADAGITRPAPMPDASPAPGGLIGERQPDPAHAAARPEGGDGATCSFAPPRGHDGNGVAATFTALLACSLALRRKRRRRAA